MKEIIITLGSVFFLSTFGANAQEVQTATTETSNIIASQGFTFEGLGRGVLGMISLLLIAYLFSNNRRNINWRTVGIGLLLQLTIAIGILKIGWIQYAFDAIGRIFVLILD